jgi:hypothetical protein
MEASLRANALQGMRRIQKPDAALTGPGYVVRSPLEPAFVPAWSPGPRSSRAPAKRGPVLPGGGHFGGQLLT